MHFFILELHFISYEINYLPGGLSNLLSSRDLNDFVVDETVLLTLISAASKSIVYL